MGAIVLGYAFGLALSALTAWAIYTPPRPVEIVERYRYVCPDMYETHLTSQDAIFAWYYLTPLRKESDESR